MTEQMTDEMTWWNAVVGWQTPDPLDEDPDALDLIMEGLEGYHAAVGGRPVAGLWEARISLQAPTLDVAVTRAIDVVAGATGETPILVEVLPEEVFLQREEYESRR